MTGIGPARAAGLPSSARERAADDAPTPAAWRDAGAEPGPRPQFDSLIKRPDADWIGRAFIGYSRAKMPI